jgi:hypothetical protein
LGGVKNLGEIVTFLWRSVPERAAEIERAIGAEMIPPLAPPLAIPPAAVAH